MFNQIKPNPTHVDLAFLAFSSSSSGACQLSEDPLKRLQKQTKVLAKKLVGCFHFLENKNKKSSTFGTSKFQKI
jgi:hypothetical protein